MEYSLSSPSMGISDISTDASGGVESMLSVVGSHASHGAEPESDSEHPTHVTCGPKWLASFVSADLHMCLPRTSRWRPLNSPGATFEEWATESRQLSASLRRTLAPLTSESGGGSLLPTPTATANMLAPSMQKWPAHRRLLPTPTARDWKSGKASQAAVVGGSLNPVWVEWLMGFPLVWTDCGRSATRKFRRWLRLHFAS